MSRDVHPARLAGPIVDSEFLSRPHQPLLVGQAPSKNSDRSDPLGDGRSSKFMAKVCGMSHSDFKDFFRRANLLAYWPGYSEGKGDAFPLLPAVIAADRLKKAAGSRITVLLGKKVAQAYGWEPGRDFLEWRGAELLFPHPSKVSHWWNSEENMLRARMVMSELVAFLKGERHELPSGCELSDRDLLEVVGGSKISAADARRNRGPGGGNGPWG